MDKNNQQQIQHKIKQEFLQAYTKNWSEVIAHARSTTWEAIAETCRISQVAGWALRTNVFKIVIL
ncbi:MAG: hypothetical protein ACFCU7_15015 [Pleurocapsa sp.]